MLRTPVTNSNTDGDVACVTTERSVNVPIGSFPALVNSVPTRAGPSGASIERNPKFFLPCMLPAHVAWVDRSASVAYAKSRAWVTPVRCASSLFAPVTASAMPASA